MRRRIICLQAGVGDAKEVTRGRAAPGSVAPPLEWHLPCFHSHRLPGRSVFRRIALFTAVFLTLGIAVVLTNQVVQLAELAARVHPMLGQGVFWGLAFALGGAFAVPLVLFFRLPRVLDPPVESEGPGGVPRDARVLVRVAGRWVGPALSVPFVRSSGRRACHTHPVAWKPGQGSPARRA